LRGTIGPVVDSAAAAAAAAAARRRTVARIGQQTQIGRADDSGHRVHRADVRIAEQLSRTRTDNNNNNNNKTTTINNNNDR